MGTSVVFFDGNPCQLREDLGILDVWEGVLLVDSSVNGLREVCGGRL
jgi:hypothetical protein